MLPQWKPQTRHTWTQRLIETCTDTDTNKAQMTATDAYVT